jgi:UDP:flavonoid glycosyltransferase YjiC (YdhE family)
VLRWEGDGRARVLAYLRPGTHGFAAAARALIARSRDSDIVLAAPGVPAAAAGTLRKAGLRVVDGPVRLDLLLPEADLMVSHGSNGVVAASLVAGVPQVLLPTQTEQFMLTRTVAAQRLAIGLGGRAEPATVGRAVSEACESPELRAASRAAAATIAATGNADPAGAVAARLLAIAAETR